MTKTIHAFNEIRNGVARCGDYLSRGWLDATSDPSKVTCERCLATLASKTHKGHMAQFIGMLVDARIQHTVHDAEDFDDPPIASKVQLQSDSFMGPGFELQFDDDGKLVGWAAWDG